MLIRPYKPNPNPWGPEPPQTIPEVLGILAGAASICWSNTSGAGEFDSTQASKFVNEAHDYIKNIIRSEINTLTDTFDLGQVVPYESR